MADRIRKIWEFLTGIFKKEIEEVPEEVLETRMLSEEEKDILEELLTENSWTNI